MAQVTQLTPYGLPGRVQTFTAKDESIVYEAVNIIGDLSATPDHLADSITNLLLTGGIEAVGPSYFGGSASYMKVEADGTIVLNGDATKWDDIQVSISNIKVPAVNDPTERLYNHGIGGGVTFPVLGFAVNDYIWFDIQTSHSMKLNTALDNHIHFILPNTTNISDKFKFQLDVIAAGLDAVFAVPSGSPFTSEHTIVANDNTHHRLLGIADIPSSNTTVSSVYSCKLTRIAASADEYGSEIYLKFNAKLSRR